MFYSPTETHDGNCANLLLKISKKTKLFYHLELIEFLKKVDFEIFKMANTKLKNFEPQMQKETFFRWI